MISRIPETRRNSSEWIHLPEFRLTSYRQFLVLTFRLIVDIKTSISLSPVQAHREPETMDKKRILVVEDERLVAKHIENMVRGLGYDVAAVVATGEDAVRTALETLPDLVLMDIMLRGDMDGITASEQIWDLAAIPVVYLTAFADDATLDRAKVTEPFGYLLKPFEESASCIRPSRWPCTSTAWTCGSKSASAGCPQSWPALATGSSPPTGKDG